MLAAQAPTIGTAATAKAAAVRRRSVGPRSTASGVAPERVAPRQAGDSGRKRRIATPRSAGAAARWKSQCHESGPTGQARVRSARRRIPALSAALVAPVTTGFEAPLQHSETSAMAFGHSPPTPTPTRNRRRSISHGSRASAPRPAKSE